MEGSTHSSMGRESLGVGEDSVASGESGWTEYFEEFLASEKRKEANINGSSSWGGGGSSMVSDAASCVLAWKSSANRVAALEGCKRLSFKKRRTRGVLDDDPLEDTASSPVSSPKVSELDKMDVSSKSKSDGSSQMQGVATGNHAELRRDDMNELGFVGRLNECSELKRRGLCLVPLSMLVEYL